MEPIQVKQPDAPSNKAPKFRARVIDIPVKKLEKGTTGSKQLPEDDPFATLSASGEAIDPPFNLFVLATMPEISPELGPCIETMKGNIDGFGHRLISRVDLDKKNIPDALRKSVVDESVRLKNFFLYAGLKKSFRSLRKDTRHDLETTGNAYWEVIRGPAGDIQYFVQIKSYQVRLTPQEPKPVETQLPIIEIQTDGSYKVVKRPVMQRFRRFVQVSSTVRPTAISTGFRMRWFKEFGDPRTYNAETGKEIKGEDLKDFPEAKKANEVIHFKLFCARSPYGLPRYIGALLSIYGDRKAEEINYVTLNNNNIPSLLVMVSNGQITQDSVDRISDHFEKLQGDDNRSKVLVIESESIADEDGEDSGTSRMEVKELGESQQKDAMYQEYGKGNRERVRVSYRLPPIFLGRSSEYNRSTAETSRKLADEQTFNPARDDFDDFINRILFPEMGIVFHQYKSNSPNTTDNSELVKILSGSEKTGGMTPRIARVVLADILGVDLPSFPEGFDPDIPFSLTMAEAVKNQADPTEPGQQLTALKRLQMLGDLTDGEHPGAYVVKQLMTLRSQLEDAWAREARLEEEHEELEE
jgi:PBSX family phage portal protein